MSKLENSAGKVILPNKALIFLRYGTRRVAYFFPPSKLKNILLKLSGISIGKNVFVGDGVKFVDGFVPDSIAIEARAVLSPSVIIVSCSYPENSQLSKNVSLTKQIRICIGRNSWIGAGSILLPGSSVGESSVLGAGSVLTKGMPQNQVWAGNPAHRLRSTKKNIDEKS